MWYKLLRKVELLRYLFIVCVIQIPMIGLIGWLLIRFWLLLQSYPDMNLAEIVSFFTPVPTPLFVWGSVVVIATLLIPSNIFNIKQQYLIHLQHKLLIEYAEDKRISIFEVNKKV